MISQGPQKMVSINFPAALRDFVWSRSLLIFYIKLFVTMGALAGGYREAIELAMSSILR